MTGIYCMKGGMCLCEINNRTDDEKKSCLHYAGPILTTNTKQQLSAYSNADESGGNPKAKWGDAKAPFFGIPMSAVIQMGTVMGGGGFKYGLFNYRETDIKASTYHDAILRHLSLYFDGEDYDPVSAAAPGEIDDECPGSGAHHLAHVMACCALMIDAQESGRLIDDRSKTGLVRKILDESAKKFAEFKRRYYLWEEAHGRTKAE